MLEYEVSEGMAIYYQHQDTCRLWYQISYLLGMLDNCILRIKCRLYDSCHERKCAHIVYKDFLLSELLFLYNCRSYSLTLTYRFVVTHIAERILNAPILGQLKQIDVYFHYRNHEQCVNQVGALLMDAIKDNCLFYMWRQRFVLENCDWELCLDQISCEVHNNNLEVVPSWMINELAFGTKSAMMLNIIDSWVSKSYL